MQVDFRGASSDADGDAPGGRDPYEGDARIQRVMPDTRSLVAVARQEVGVTRGLRDVLTNKTEVAQRKAANLAAKAAATRERREGLARVLAQDMRAQQPPGAAGDADLDDDDDGDSWADAASAPKRLRGLAASVDTGGRKAVRKEGWVGGRGGEEEEEWGGEQEEEEEEGTGIGKGLSQDLDSMAASDSLTAVCISWRTRTMWIRK